MHTTMKTSKQDVSLHHRNKQVWHPGIGPPSTLLGQTGSLRPRAFRDLGEAMRCVTDQIEIALHRFVESGSRHQHHTGKQYLTLHRFDIHVL